MPLYPGPQGPQGSSGATGSTGAQGSTGSTGAQGAQGAQGTAGTFVYPAGVRLSGSWTYNSGTAGPTANGEVRFNHATQTSATAMFVDDDDTTPIDRSAEIDAWTVGSFIYVLDSFTPSTGPQLLVYVTGTVVNSTGYRTVPCTVTSLNGGNFTGGPLRLINVPRGATGAQGAAGATGAQGAQGAAGSTGAQGAQGPAGNNGSTGAQGAQGTAGSTGSQGSQGPTGPSDLFNFYYLR